jgi:ABC-type multidrug transport system fused ATPase/permease subunit
VRVHGSVAFCDQRPWILNDTVQGNVLFGQEYEETRFDAALYASSLEDDVTILPGGVNTQIGKYVAGVGVGVGVGVCCVLFCVCEWCMTSLL